MQAVFPAIKAAAGGVDALDWLNAKFRFYAIDMENAGPAAGAWKISTSSTDTGDPLSGYRVTFTTTAAHGLVAGDKIAMFGNTTKARPWASGARVQAGGWLTPTTPNGKKYKILTNGLLGTTEPTWPTIDGQVVTSASIGLVCDGADTVSPFNVNFEVSSVPSTTTFRSSFSQFPYAPLAAANGYIANLFKTYLSEFAASGARTASGDIPLSGRSILSGAIFDGGDVQINMTSRPLSQALMLVKVAALHANTDLADTAQRLVVYYDTQTGLPLAANSGITDLLMSNGPDRIFRW